MDSIWRGRTRKELEGKIKLYILCLCLNLYLNYVWWHFVFYLKYFINGGWAVLGTFDNLINSLFIIFEWLCFKITFIWNLKEHSIHSFCIDFMNCSSVYIKTSANGYKCPFWNLIPNKWFFDRFKNQILCDLHFADMALMESSDFMQQLRNFKAQSLGCAVAR